MVEKLQRYGAKHWESIPSVMADGEYVLYEDHLARENLLLDAFEEFISAACSGIEAEMLKGVGNANFTIEEMRATQ